jgi:HEPN domain-containing protein
MPERHLDWLRQARFDLDHARLAAREGHLEWAVFAAQSQPPTDLLDRAWALDKHYIPSRCPNGFAAGIPRDHYTEREAATAIADAEAIVDFCARSISR